MPIGFRCTGCRSRLHVPKRWAGNSLPCPKCGTRVVVPAAAEGHEPTAFEDAAVERSIELLEVSRASTPGGIFAADSFELPSPDDADAVPQFRDGSRNGITLSRRAIYAYVILVPVIAAAAFGLGCWWTAAGGR
jgi:hypothetical protein